MIFDDSFEAQKRTAQMVSQGLLMSGEIKLLKKQMEKGSSYGKDN